MFYYEDVLDHIQNVPQETRDGLEKIGEIDKEVKESMECTKKNVHTLFSNADKMSPEDLDASFKAFMKDGETCVDLSETKIQLASNMQAIMEKYLSLIDNQLNHFKIELEANDSGITNIIEKRVLDEEQCKITKLQGKRGQLNRRLFGGKLGVLDNSNFNKKLISVASSSTSSEDTSSSPEMVKYDKNSPNSSNLTKSFALEKSGNPGNASSTSQAVITNQKTTKGRQKVSLRPTNSEALQSTLSKEEYKLSSTSSTKNKKKQKKSQIPSESATESIDSNEPRYCTCNDVAYGSMVACDNKTCPIEWFHYECVGVVQRPRGKWYCSSCAKTVKNRRYRKST